MTSIVACPAAAVFITCRDSTWVPQVLGRYTVFTRWAPPARMCEIGSTSKSFPLFVGVPSRKRTESPSAAFAEWTSPLMITLSPRKTRDADTSTGRMSSPAGPGLDETALACGAM